MAFPYRSAIHFLKTLGIVRSDPAPLPAIQPQGLALYSLENYRLPLPQPRILIARDEDQAGNQGYRDEPWPQEEFPPVN